MLGKEEVVSSSLINSSAKRRSILAAFLPIYQQDTNCQKTTKVLANNHNKRHFFM